MKLSSLIPVAFFVLLLSPVLNAQQINLEGYTFENDNRGYLKKVHIIVMEMTSREIYADTISDKDGHFNLQLPANKSYQIIASKKHFFQLNDTISTINKKDEEKLFVKIEMERKPGYVFDVTLAEAKIEGQDVVNSVQGARIEVFNNTTRMEELVLKKYPHPNFKFNFENGNHYTIMIRRKGYFNKRIEAYINIEGCILCFDGLGIVDPGVTDVLSNGNNIGTFLANIELQPLKIDKTFTLNNIYYDYNKSDIRPDAAKELDRLVGVLKDNPGVIVELGSHTDARGKAAYNLSLSQKRAQSAVEYLIASAGMSSQNLKSKGYGETRLVNTCSDNRTCTDQLHQQNRRTELKVIGIKKEDPLDNKSLKEILLEERLLEEVLNSKEIKISKL